MRIPCSYIVAYQHNPLSFHAQHLFESPGLGRTPVSGMSRIFQRSAGHCGPVQVWPIYPFTLTLTIFSSPQAAWTTAKTWEAQVATDGWNSLLARTSLDVTGCHWTLVAGSFKKTWSRYHQPKTPPKSTSSAITSQGAPEQKKTGSQESICIWFTATHILATILPFTKLHPCHLGQYTKRAGLSQVKYVHGQTVTMLCYAINIAAASEYRSVQSNTCAGMTSDASSVICKCNSGEKWVQGLSDHATKNIKTLIGTGSYFILCF